MSKLMSSCRGFTFVFLISDKKKTEKSRWRNCPLPTETSPCIFFKSLFHSGLLWVLGYRESEVGSGASRLYNMLTYAVRRNVLLS